MISNSVSKFDDILKRYGVIVEDAAAAPAGTEASALPGVDASAPVAPEGAAETIDNQQPAEATSEKMSPEGYVTLVKLLKTAFCISPSEEDSAAIDDLKFTGPGGEETTEINPSNADEAFQKILPFISKYASREETVESLLRKV